jgi:hypothetical protein
MSTFTISKAKIHYFFDEKRIDMLGYVEFKYFCCTEPTYKERTPGGFKGVNG